MPGEGVGLSPTSKIFFNIFKMPFHPIFQGLLGASHILAFTYLTCNLVRNDFFTTNPSVGAVTVNLTFFSAVTLAVTKFL